MIARLKSIVRALRIAIARRLRQPAHPELLTAEGTFERVLQLRRAIVIGGAVALAAWVLLAQMSGAIR